MKFKKVLFVLLALLLLCGCGSKQKSAVAFDSSAVIIDPNATDAPVAKAATAAPAATSAPLSETIPAQTELTELAEEDPYTFYAGDVKILPRMEADPVLKALGEPAYCFEADSCAYLGKDEYYSYNGFEIAVNTVEGKRVITAIRVVDDTIRVPFQDGTLAIGDSAETVCKLFGVEPGLDQYVLHSPGVHLQIALKDGRVSVILFLAPEEY